jgi:hypothetical protein
MKSIDDLLRGRPPIGMAVSVNPAGQVLKFAGEGDVESFGAMTAMCNQGMVDAGEALGLGEVLGWVAVTDERTFYCADGQGTLFAGLGNASKTAAGALDKFIASATRSWG